MRRYTLITVLFLAGAGGAGAQAPAEATAVPAARGAWTPEVIATARPVAPADKAVTPAAALPPGTAPVPDYPTKATPAPPVPEHKPAPPSPDAVRLTSAQAAPARGAAAPAPCLVVEKRAPAVVPPGKPLDYEIVVRNIGGAEAQHVRVEEQLPPGASVVDAAPRPEVHVGALTWELGSLAADAERRLRVSLRVAEGGDVTTSATVTCATTCVLRARVAKAGLSLTVSAPPAAQVGERVTFQIALANNTPAPVRRLLLRDRLPAGLQHQLGSLIETDLPPLAPGESKVIPLEVKAAGAGRMVNVVTLTGEGVAEINAQATVEVINPAAAPAPAPKVVPPAAEVKPAAAPDPPAGKKPAAAPPGKEDVPILPPFPPVPSKDEGARPGLRTGGPPGAAAADAVAEADAEKRPEINKRQL